MGLLPDTSMSDLGTSLGTYTQTSTSYKMLVDDDRIKGNTRSNLEAMEQAVYKVLNTERCRYPIYSWNYGVELAGLFGKPKVYCIAEIPTRITEALLADDRIESVDEFELSEADDYVNCKFTVHTIYGDLRLEKKVGVT